MKAVVLEIKNEKAAVLAEDGSIKRIPDNGYSIGQEIEIPQASAKSAVWTGCRRRFAAAAACAAMAVVVGGGLFYASETVFAYSTVDIKTDTGVIQLKLNRKDQLISITADHETDAELTGIISGLLQEHSSLDEAVAALSESIDSEAEISVQSSDCGHAADLREEVKKMMPAKPETAEEGTDTSADQTEKDTAAGEKSSLHTSAQNDHDVKAEDGRSVPSGKEKQDRYDALPSGMSGGIAAGMSDPADGEQVIPGNAKNAENDPEDPKMNDPEDSKMQVLPGKQGRLQKMQRNRRKQIRSIHHGMREQTGKMRMWLFLQKKSGKTPEWLCRRTKSRKRPARM